MHTVRSRRAKVIKSAPLVAAFVVLIVAVVVVSGDAEDRVLTIFTATVAILGLLRIWWS